MLKTFFEFITESQNDDNDKIETQPESQDPKKTTLFIIGDIGYDSPDIQWFLTIDVKDIWNEYKSKSIDFKEFVKKYNDKITEKKEKLQEISDTCWYDIEEIIGQSIEYDEEKSNKYLNRVYDWADENGVKIDTGVKPEIQNDNVQNDETQPQNNNTIQ